MKLFYTLENYLLGILWPTLPLASVVYSALIAGTWLNVRITTHYPNLDGLGYFGAGLAASVLFGGVALIVRGRWGMGLPAAFFPALALIIMDGMFFASDGFLVAAPLALFGVLSAITAGVVNTANIKDHEEQERAQTQAAEERAQQEREAQAQREREEQARREAQREREHEHQRQMERIKLENDLELARIEARARARALSYSIPSHSTERNGTEQERAPIPFHPIPRNGTERNDARLVEYVEQNPNATFDDITEALGIARSTASRRLTAAGWHKNGNGWERSA